MWTSKNVPGDDVNLEQIGHGDVWGYKVEVVLTDTNERLKNDWTRDEGFDKGIARLISHYSTHTDDYCNLQSEGVLSGVFNIHVKFNYREIRVSSLYIRRVQCSDHSPYNRNLSSEHQSLGHEKSELVED